LVLHPVLLRGLAACVLNALVDAVAPLDGMTILSVVFPSRNAGRNQSLTQYIPQGFCAVQHLASGGFWILLAMF
jgi:hypothetical protein